jgi:hypothetical protein
MDTESLYVLIETEKSFCPKCHNTVGLLTSTQHRLPSFYICFSCKYVGEVGVGPVKLPSEDIGVRIE